MRKFLQFGVALVLAVSLAAPACCCVFSEKALTAEASSCCGGGSELPDHHDCGCVNLEALAEWKVQETLPCNPPQLPVLAGYETQGFDLSPVLLKAETARGFHAEVLPSLRRHALLQRFLI